MANTIFDFKPIPSITPRNNYWENGTWKFNSPEITAGSAYAPSYIDVILHGVTALTLVNAKANGLNYLKLFGGTEQVPETYIDSVTLEGKCEQNGTPTPTVPVDIVCNNGTIKVSPNLVTRAGETLDKFYNASGVEQNGVYPNYNFAHTDFIKVRPNTTYTFGFKVSYSYNSYINHRVIGWTSSKTYVKEEANIIEPENTAIGTPLYTTFTTSATTEYITINFVYSPLETELQLVEGSALPTKYIPYGSIYYDGTVETATDNVGNVATAQPLLSVGDYKDTQEVISGAVTRNVGVKPIKGNMVANYFPSSNRCIISTGNIIATHTPILCTHFPVVTSGNYYINHSSDNQFIYCYSKDCASLEDYQNFFDNLYNAGTPAIVVYPLATATTESVSGQVLNKTPITYAGSLSGLTGTVIESSHTVPTPTQPLDIVANNGVITLSPNLIDESTLYIVSSTMCRYYSTVSQGGFDLKANTTYTLSTNNPDVYVYFYDYDTKTSLASGKNHRTYTPTADVKVYFTLYLSSGIPEDTHIQLEIGSTATTYRPYGSIYYDGDIETVEVIGKNLFDGEIEIGSINPADGSLVVNSSRTRSKNFIRVKPNTTYTFTREDTNGIRWIVGYNENKVGITDGNFSSQASAITNLQASSTVTKTFTTTATTYYIKWYNTSNAGLNEKVQVELGDTATTYEPYFNGGTATAQPLLKVGDYQDVQSVLNGAVTRNVGVKVLSGTESWTLNVASEVNRYNTLLSDTINIPTPNVRFKIPCTHFKYVASGQIEGVCFLYANKGLWFIPADNANIDTVDKWKAWLKDQYNAGTPVIVVYPLATATTESVTAQPMSIQAGTNVVEITQASIDNLELEVSYKAGVEVTVEEIEAVNNDESVEVTING